MMRYILAVLILVLTSYAYEYDINSLIEEAKKQVYKEESQILLKKAINALKNKDYTTAVISAKKFLKLNEDFSLETEIVYEILAISYYRLGYRQIIRQKAKPYIKEMKNLLKQIDKLPVSYDSKLRIFIYANNLFLKAGDFKYLSKLRKDFSYLFSRDYFLVPDPDYEMFIPNVNIFKIEDKNMFGKNEVYISEKNQSLVEIAKSLDMGYDELKVANKYLDPNDIKKGEAVFVPRKRLIPEENYNFGEIYINLSEKRLYYPVKIGKTPYVITVPVGVGTDENRSPVGDFKITEKRKNPEWRVPKSIREENPDLPEVVPPGPDNPLGTRAMRLGNTSFLMHGTSKKFGIGMKVSHGCIRMYNRDVEKLFEVVKKGTPVHIVEKDFKLYRGKIPYIEVFKLSQKDKNLLLKEITGINTNILEFTGEERKGYATPLK